jgi:hypothetical protein
VETWDDVGSLASRIPGVQAIVTQPERMGLTEVDGPLGSRRYAREVQPLLAEMERAFERHAGALAGAASGVRPELAPLAADVVDAARVTALRARQMLGLYDRASGLGNAAWSASRLAAARAALDEAARIARGREAHYRVAPERIAGWGANPTSYAFGYLWTARTLHFWWRDEGRVAHGIKNPCYLNVIHPAEVATAEGAENSLYQRVERIVRALGPAARWIDGCLHPPAGAPDHRSIVRPAAGGSR